MESFGVPGASLLGSDSHSCAAGGIGPAGDRCRGLEVALALAGEPFFLPMPEIWAVKPHGQAQALGELCSRCSCLARASRDR